MINHGLFAPTAPNGDDVGGGGTNWLSQASFDPPLIMAGAPLLLRDTGTN